LLSHSRLIPSPLRFLPARAGFGGKERSMRARFLVAPVLSLACLASAGRGDEWPQFRGPGGTGVTAEKQLPQQWAADKNVQWKVKVPGRGWSAPIVWGDKVFITAAFTEKERVARAAGGGRGGGGRPGGGPGGFGRGGPGGFGPPRPGQILSPFLQERLNLSDE